MATWYGTGDLKLFDPVQGLGLYLKDPPTEVRQSYDDLFRTLRALKKVTASNGVDLVVVVFAQRFQVQNEDWSSTVADYHLNESCFDLNLPNRLVADFCVKNAIVCIDPTTSMAAAHGVSSDSLYCPEGDMHLNAEGNRVMFEAIKDQVLKHLAPASPK